MAVALYPSCLIDCSWTQNLQFLFVSVQEGSPPTDMTEYFSTEENHLTHQERTKRYWKHTEFLYTHYLFSDKVNTLLSSVQPFTKLTAGAIYILCSLPSFLTSLSPLSLSCLSFLGVSRFELAYTHTKYYLAQVYQYLGESSLLTVSVTDHVAISRAWTMRGSL